MPAIRSVAVFCGAHAGSLPAYRQAAETLGRGLADAGIRLVFGGGRVGLMGALADAALAAGGEVVGVIPEFLTRLEVAHQRVDRLVISDSMHARKQRMYELSDAFVMLPGGIGTYDETIEVITWRQLRLHDKPILICDVAGSAEPLVGAIEAAIARGFAAPSVRGLFTVTDGPGATLAALQAMTAGEGAEAARL
ncbi:MAG TPA: TIGR00730 family Rossman fold protein [Acetobacteraceae bacterium]|nr:TIGR00730 family Rossman fold protein [Acetobacteraceae bacterium]